MKKIKLFLLMIFLFFTSVINAQPEVEIPHAKPGSCYAKCLIADEYTTEKEQVEIKPASSKVEIIPAQYESVTEQVLVKEAATRIERIPAEYETVTQSYVKGCPVGYEPEDGNLIAGGNCIRLISVPAEYEIVTEQVLIKEAGSRLEIIPPIYENITEQIFIKAAYIPSRRIHPRQYETITEQVLVKEASTGIERKPVRYKSQSEQIEIAPAATKWIKKKANRNCLSADPNDCIVWCLVETPATYQTIIKKIQIGCEEGWTADRGDCIREIEIPAEYTTRTLRKLGFVVCSRSPPEIPAEYRTLDKIVIKTPAQIRTIETLAEYTTHTVRKLKTAATTRKETAPVIMGNYTTQVRKGCPAGYSEDIVNNGKGDCIRTIAIPAEYTNRSFQKLVSPAAIKTIPVPAEYITVSRRVLVKKGGAMEWREVECAGDVTNVTVRKIQEALIAHGYDPGPANNEMNAKTKAALVKYQKDNNIPVCGYGLEVMKSLGVSY